MQGEIFQKEQEFRIKFGIQSITTIITILIVKGLSFISTKVYTNFLPKDEFGIFSFWISFILFVSGFCTSVFSASIWRYLAEKADLSDPSWKSRLFTLSFTGSFVFLIAFFIFIYSAFLITDFMLIETSDYFFVLILIFFISSIYVIKELVLVLSGAEQNSREIFYFNLSFGIISLGGSCIAAILYSNYIAVLLGLSLGFFIPITISIFLKLYQYGLTLPTKSDIKKVFNYGGPRTIMRSFTLFVPFLCFFMVSIWLGKSEVATLSVGFSIAAILSMILDSFLVTYRPYMTNSYEEGLFDKANRITTRIIELFLIFSLFVFFWIINLIPFLIELISTHEYLDAITLIPFIIFSYFLISFSYFWLVRIDLSERTYLSAIIHSLAFLVLFISCYVFIPSLKLIGVGFALLTHSLVVSILTICVGNSLLKINLNKNFVIKLILSLSVGITVFLLFNNIGFLMIISLVGFSLFYIMMLFGTGTLTIKEVRNVVRLFKYS